MIGISDWALAVLLAVGSAGSAAAAESWLVAGPAELLEGIAPLVEHRKAEGFEVVVASDLPEEALKEHRPDYLLVLGDDEEGSEAAWNVPGPRRPLYRWIARQRPEFLADPAWGDFDNDGQPDIPVGRIPARSRAEAEFAAKKIIAFGRREARVEDLCLPVWAGAGGYGEALDRLSLSLLTTTLKRHSPDWTDNWTIAASIEDPRVAWPADQARLFHERLSKGALLAAMMGHGDAQMFYAMQVEDRWFGSSVRDPMRFDESPAAPLFIVACNCGYFGHQQRSLAESYLFAPGGPVAVIASTTQSHPLTNYYSATSLLRELDEGHARLGTLWKHAQDAGFAQRERLIEFSLKNVEGKLEDEIDIGKLKRDQRLMYALLGDPATRLRLPEKLEVTIEPDDTGWKWRATKPAGATSLQLARKNEAPLPERLAPKDREEALQRFEAATAATAFSVETTLTAEQEWSGRLDQSGEYRFAAVAGPKLHVAVRELRRAE